MNPTEFNENLLATLWPLIITAAATGIVSWKLFEVIKDQIEKEKNRAALKTVGTVCLSVLMLGATGGSLWMGWRWLRPKPAEVKAEPPPKPPEARPEAAPPSTPPQNPSRSESAFRPRIRPGRHHSQSSAPVTSQPSNAPTTAQTSQAPEAAQPAPTWPPQAPATETRPLFKAEPSAPGCIIPTPPPATPIVPPGEKVPEQDQLV